MLGVHKSSIGVLNCTRNPTLPKKGGCVGGVEGVDVKFMITPLSVFGRMAINGTSLSWDRRPLYQPHN